MTTRKDTRLSTAQLVFRTSGSAAKMASAQVAVQAVQVSLGTTIEHYCKEIMELRIQVRDLSCDNEKIKEEKEKLQQEVDALKIENVHLRTDLACHNKRTHISELNAVIRGLNAEVENAQRENEELRAKCLAEEEAM